MTRHEPAERLWQARLATKREPRTRSGWASGTSAYATQPGQRRGTLTFEVGQRFGRLVVAAERVPGARKVRCRCDCGTERDYSCGSLRSGGAQSCGCSRRSETTQ